MHLNFYAFEFFRILKFSIQIPNTTLVTLSEQEIL